MKRLSQEEVDKRILNKTDGKIKVISKWKGVNKMVLLECQQCKHNWQINGRRIVHKDTRIICPQCQKILSDKPFCVYIHIFPNKKVYIGISSTNVKKRWDCGRGYKTQSYMANAINKYGWENIEHKVLYSHLTQEEASQKEIELIKQYKSNNPKFGYNIAKGGYNNFVSTYYAVKYDLSGNYINKYDSIMDASRKTGICYKSIENCFTGKQKKAGNFLWIRIEHNQQIPNKIQPYINNRGCKSQFKNQVRKIKKIDNNNQCIKVYNSITEAAKEINRDVSSLCEAIKEHHRCAGYYWEYYKGDE